MKLIIDVPEAPLYRDMYTAICENGYIFDEDNEYIAKAIKNGTPIPDNATNKDIVKAVFGEESYNHCLQNVSDWWNAPYQKGGNSEYLGGELYEGEFENR